MAQLGGDARHDGKLADGVHLAAQRVVQDGRPLAARLEDELDRNGGGELRVEVGGDLAAQSDELGVGEDVAQLGHVNRGVASSAGTCRRGGAWG